MENFVDLAIYEIICGKLLLLQRNNVKLCRKFVHLNIIKHTEISIVFVLFILDQNRTGCYWKR